MKSSKIKLKYLFFVSIEFILMTAPSSAMLNYFNQLNFRDKLNQLSQCRFMTHDEFSFGCQAIQSWNIVIIGCGAQGLNQGLNMRDSGLNITYTLRESSIKTKRPSWIRATENDFLVQSFEKAIPQADLVLNLTPDKQHTSVIQTIMPLMKKGATLAYSHGFNIVEEGMCIRSDITVIMVAPKCPGTEVRQEYLRGFGVPTLIAVHPENDPNKKGLSIAKAYACATGGDKAGVLESSFVAEVKSDLMGEQTILCGMLQTGSILAHEKLVREGMNSAYARKLIQYGWETITEALKHGGITHMMNRLNNPSKLRAYQLSNELKALLHPLFTLHMDQIIDGTFSKNMMKDWSNNDQQLLQWRDATRSTSFEQAPDCIDEIDEQSYYDQNTFLVAMIKAGVELAFEAMTNVGIVAESAYYESLHETPLIANCIARNKLYEMNVVISDTAEYGNYLFCHQAIPLLKGYVEKLSSTDLGESLSSHDAVDNIHLIQVNNDIHQHPVEKIGRKLRKAMKNMKKIHSQDQSI
jgi:ketol-acid reductoisomerase